MVDVDELVKIVLLVVSSILLISVGIMIVYTLININKAINDVRVITSNTKLAFESEKEAKESIQEIVSGIITKSVDQGLDKVKLQAINASLGVLRKFGVK